MIVHGYSRFPVIKIVKSTSSTSTVPVLDKVFSEFGIPTTVKSDNGHPFQSTEFSQCGKHLGFIHRKTTPLWPQANGEAERLMQPLIKAIRSAVVETKPWKQELPCHTTSHNRTNHPEPSATNVKDTTVRRRDTVKKHGMKVYADKLRKAKTVTFSPGDYVLVRQTKKIKFSTPFDPKPYKVISVNGSMVTAERSRQMITRKRAFFKPITTSANSHFLEEEKDDKITSSPSNNCNLQQKVYPSRNRKPNRLLIQEL